MATKYYCDGCDKEISWRQDMKRQVNVSDGQQTTSGGEFELCQSCARRLDEQANPKSWVRSARPTKAA